MLIAFESARSTGEGAPSDIFVVRADGTDLVNLSAGMASALGPSWAPDGLRLAFLGFEADRATSNIYVVEVGTLARHRLTNSPAGHGTGSVSWSPSGNSIAYVSQRSGNSDIYVVRPDGSDDTNLTRHPAADFAGIVGGPPLAWSPDGTKVAFLSDRSGNVDAFVIDAHGGNLVRLTSDPGLQWNPLWSADGRCLTYYTSGPPMSVFLVGSDGAGMSLLTTLR